MGEIIPGAQQKTGTEWLSVHIHKILVYQELLHCSKVLIQGTLQSMQRFLLSPLRCFRTPIAPVYIWPLHNTCFSLYLHDEFLSFFKRENNCRNLCF